jgi:ribonuclease BN (tRNA processing enzyme)
MRPPTFPVRFEDVPARLTLQQVSTGRVLELGEARVLADRLNHPGGVLGYRIEHEGCAVVYATDTEHEPAADERLVALARDADLLIYDSMYTPEEYLGHAGPAKTGWGHSTFREGARIARAAGVRTLALFHHDPTRTDLQVRTLLRRAQDEHERVVVAREGLRIELPPRSRAAA